MGAVFYNVWALCKGSVCLMLKGPPVISFLFFFFFDLLINLFLGRSGGDLL